MTYKKAYIILSIYFLVAFVCMFIFENSTLNAFLIVGLIVLCPLLKGYAKDNENQQQKKV
ncbi:hypothetical protein AEA09_03760 [Lysinibacillus contaminans]|uniref:Lipoprotein n=1 Tax=Lysinibacillus contaminans TaxID=1293441 RepID=A0ABR5JYM8_9BACI|nr:hypothetical protein AEA09_03760 [Lysinibacillus contaminans]